MRNIFFQVTLGIGINLCVQHTPAQETVDLSSVASADTFYVQNILAMKVARLHCLAERGENTAQYELGLLYRHGLGVQQDVSEAVYWLEIAAFSGHAQASYALAMLYAEYEESDNALHWMGVAAKQGDDKAKHVYDYMLNNDFGYGC